MGEEGKTMEVKRYEEPREAAVSSVAVAASTTDKPRLCQVLGVDVGERFKVLVGDKEQELLGLFWVSRNGRFFASRDFALMDTLFALCEAINHPEKIERIPHLTEKEREICLLLGAKWVSRDVDGDLVRLWENKPKERDNGLWDYGTRCAWIRVKCFPSVRPGQLIQVEDAT